MLLLPLEHFHQCEHSTGGPSVPVYLSFLHSLLVPVTSIPEAMQHMELTVAVNHIVGCGLNNKSEPSCTSLHFKPFKNLL